MLFSQKTILVVQPLSVVVSKDLHDNRRSFIFFFTTTPLELEKAVQLHYLTWQSGIPRWSWYFAASIQIYQYTYPKLTLGTEQRHIYNLIGWRVKTF